MDFMTTLLERESCRSYIDKPVSREDLIKIVEAGRLSPSACNSQPWKFVIIDEPESKAKMADALVLDNGDTGCSWAASVPAFIILAETPAKIIRIALKHYQDSQVFAKMDLGMAVMNMCYQAKELGLSTCILGLNDQKKMEKNFGIPEGFPVRMVLAVGYSEQTEPRPKVRKTFEEICSFNQW